MAQVLERVKTFFIMMTKNENIEMIDNTNIEKAVERIRAQESGNIKRMEKEIEAANIPLEEEKIVKKVKVNEKIAQKELEAKQRIITSKERQIGEE